VAFGETLRRYRERSGVTIETIARQTKISASLLTALERGDCSRWPTGIYSRAYIRDYAQAIGLDPDDLAAQFSACFTLTAFPEGVPALALKPANPVPAAPLRLTLEAEPNGRWRVVRYRTLRIVLDLLLVLATAGILRFTLLSSFWMALAGVSLLFHAIVLGAGGTSVAGHVLRLLRVEPEPEPAETPQESAVAEPA
jgi:transcriptional regulator with XRE-family HTH domain